MSHAFRVHIGQRFFNAVLVAFPLTDRLHGPLTVERSLSTAVKLEFALSVLESRSAHLRDEEENHNYG